VQLESKDGQSIGSAHPIAIGKTWELYEAQITPTVDATDARLAVYVAQRGGADLDMISLFPEKTFKNRLNGMRADLAQMLADMHPSFMRFPGGCIVEGDCRENMYRWKNTIGDIADRAENHNRWMGAVPTKAPQYYQTFGLGFFEYFQLCEDIGAEPLPVINCGMTCQFQPEHGWVAPLSEMGEFVQDALDLVEFANGPVTSTWGAKRAAMGHPAPFNMKMMAIGNEQWGEDYFPRYNLFYKALKEKHPEIKLVTTAGPAVDDLWWTMAWDKFHKNQPPAEIVDEHYYRVPRWFYEQADRYSANDRNGPKIFAGEYAAHPLGLRNSMHGALAEAAFLTGLVKNSDVVALSSYAPLFAKIGDSQWVPDMIYFTNTTVYGTPSYHVQSLFSNNKGDVVLPADIQAPSTPVVFQGKAMTLFAENAVTEFRNLKVTSGNQTILAPEFNGTAAPFAPERGEFTAKDGILRSEQLMRGRTVAHVTMPENVTISLQARKISGTGGFGLRASSDTDEITWLLGARNNIRHQMELSWDITPVEGTLETGKWYDIKLDLSGRTAKAYLDGKLEKERELPVQKGLYAVATRENATKDVIVKVVNPTAQAMPTSLKIEGATLQGSGKQIVLTAAKPEDENSLEQPNLVAPKESPLTNIAANSSQIFAPYSVTVLRLKSQ
jgi:alpha-L-arabinofuranosidase